jgi:MOSC domain-containing protein YiiM
LVALNGGSEAIVLLGRHPARFRVAEAIRIMHEDKNNVGTLQTILQLPELSVSWGRTLERRLDGLTKDEKARLEG